MNSKIDAFLSEVRNMPAFVTAAAADPEWFTAFAGIERGLNALSRLADNDPAIIDIFDEVQTVIGRGDLSLKQRLLEVGRLLTQVRDMIKITH